MLIVCCSSFCCCSSVLKFLHQGEDSLWFVLNRETNETTLITGKERFVNNHFWNCFEDAQGKIVVETVAATEDYLDTYFARNLAEDHPDWDKICKLLHKCVILFLQLLSFSNVKNNIGHRSTNNLPPKALYSSCKSTVTVSFA